MRKSLLFIPVVLILFPTALGAQGESLSASNFSEFLSRYETALDPVDQAYQDLGNENLPLRDETGQPLGRRHIEDRRDVVSALRLTVRQLVSNPQDLALTIALFVKTEALVDDLFGLSQVAYDNDREELGKHLSDLEASFDHQCDLIEAYTLKAAAETRGRIQELEKQNHDLQEKLKAAAEKPKAKSPARP